MMVVFSLTICSDIIGPNKVFVAQSGTFRRRFTDFTKESTDDEHAREADLQEQALSKDMNITINDQTKFFHRVLGGLGSHDLSAMREIIGLPKRVIGTSNRFPMWQTLFEYDNFSVLYESGINNLPVFDAGIEIFSSDKSVTIKYDTPYVRGLPTVMLVKERVGESGYQERTLRTTSEDPYTKEFLEWHDCIVTGRTPKTTIEDARQDLEIFKIIMQADQKER